MLKRRLNHLLALTALLFTALTASAEQPVAVTVLPEGAGTVTAAVSATDGICTLTVTPTEGYYITASDIAVRRTIIGGQAQSPRRSPDIDTELIALTPVESSADPSDVTHYTFKMPDADYGIMVTANFQQRKSIADATITLAQTQYVYDGTERKPAVTVGFGDQQLADSDFEVVYTDNIYAGEATVTVTGKQAYTGTATLNFTITTAPLVLSFATSDVTVDMSSQQTYQQALTTTPAVDGLKIVWSSTDDDTAEVDENGNVTIKRIGLATITASFEGDNRYQSAQSSYTLKVTTTYGLTVAGIPVTSENRTNILNDAIATVSFDGGQVLKLENAKLELPISTTFDVLTIYLKGENSMKGVETAIVGPTDGTLIFTTEGNSPGLLTLTNTLGQKVIDGFLNIQCQQNMALLSGHPSQSNLSVGVPINPFVDDNTGNKKEVDLQPQASAAEDLSNTAIGDVLYTLDKDNGDGVSGNEDCVVLSSTMIEDDVSGTVVDVKPGTDEFAEKFTGLTFMVPAGTGTITVTVKTGSKGVLMLKIGQDEPYVIKGALDFTEYVFPYACPEATYVYIYNASEVSNEAASRRAGKKTTITVGIRTVGVKAEELQPSNGSVEVVTEDATLNPVSATTNDIVVSAVDDNNVITVEERSVVALPDNLFENQSYTTSIDLRETSVSGMLVSRSSGAFKGISANTFIYMPSGNSTEESNVVFGFICPWAELDAQMPSGESFGPIAEFTAQRISYGRVFARAEAGTIYLPFDIDKTTASLFGTFYSFERVANGYVKVNEVTDGLKANTPYLFKAIDDQTQIVLKAAKVRLPETPAASRAAATDGLVGCYGHHTATDVYRIENDDDMSHVRFVRLKAGVEILPFQAYLQLSGTTAESLEVTDQESVVTGIGSVDNGAAATKTWQTLSGMQLHERPTAKGVYIHNGKKMVIR